MTQAIDTKWFHSKNFSTTFVMSETRHRVLAIRYDAARRPPPRASRGSGTQHSCLTWRCRLLVARETGRTPLHLAPPLQTTSRSQRTLIHTTRGSLWRYDRCCFALHARISCNLIVMYSMLNAISIPVLNWYWQNIATIKCQRTARIRRYEKTSPNC